MREAAERMHDAEEALRQAQREGAIEAERDAERLLEQAKAQLKRILRQMREDEVERTLANLESRFRKMLESQLRINQATNDLAKTIGDAEVIPRAAVVRSSKLSLDQRQNVTEADKALTLLREEGSSVVFPEVASQLRDDMQQVARRLDATRIDGVTLDIEADIVASLEEIVAALQTAQQEAKKRKESPPSPPSNSMQQGTGEEPLVNALAELKMLRSLQLRVNRRTTTYAEELDAQDDLIGQATDADLVEALHRLSQRQADLHEITRNIVVGKNRK